MQVGGTVVGVVVGMVVGVVVGGVVVVVLLVVGTFVVFASVWLPDEGVVMFEV